MAAKRNNHSRGVTLVEVAVATLVIAIAALGALSYEFYGARQASMAKAYTAAARIGSFLLQDWRANGGSIHYITGVAAVSNPVALDMGFVKLGTGVYKITVDNIPMRIELLRDAKDYPLVEIAVTVRWRVDFADSPIRSRDPSLMLTTYARAGQSSG